MSPLDYLRSEQDPGIENPHLLHLRQLFHASKRTTGGKVNSLSVTINGLISTSISAFCRISIMSVFIRTNEKVPKRQRYSKQNSFPYLSLCQNFSGPSLRHFGRGATLSLLAMPSQRISQPTSRYTSPSSSLFRTLIGPSLPIFMRSISQADIATFPQPRTAVPKPVVPYGGHWSRE